MKIKLFALSLIALFVGGCAELSDTLGDTGDRKFWVKYLENDGTLSYAKFMKSASINKARNGSYIGYALSGTEKEGKIFTKEKIGSMYQAEGDNTIIIYNLDANEDFDTSNQTSMANLKISRNIKFYTIGNLIIESIVFSGERGICAEYKAGNRIKARSVTNYMITSDESAATIIEANIDKNGYKMNNIEYKYNVLKDKQEDVKKAIESDRFKQIIDKDLAKQKRILENILCAF